MKSISSLQSCVEEASQLQNDKLQSLTTLGTCLLFIINFNCPVLQLILVLLLFKNHLKRSNVKRMTCTH